MSRYTSTSTTTSSACTSRSRSRISQHVADVKPSRVEVTGFRAATRLSDGQLLVERDSMGSIRARKVADTLAGLGVPGRLMTISAPPEAQPADGVNDPWNRRVEIRVR
jgi:outer membrane protein OmpA-like peptidoglycan-associated protein